MNRSRIKTLTAACLVLFLLVVPAAKGQQPARPTAEPSTLGSSTGQRLPEVSVLPEPLISLASHQEAAPTPPPGDDEIEELRERLEATENQLLKMSEQNKNAAEKLLELLTDKRWITGRNCRGTWLPRCRSEWPRRGNT